MVRGVRPWRWLFCVLMLIAVSLASAQAAQEETLIFGYFVDPVPMYAQPLEDAQVVGTVPANTPLALTPGEHGFGYTSYGGVGGYVHLVDVQRAEGETLLSSAGMSQVTQVTPYMAYSEGIVAVLAAPDAIAPMLEMLPARTPLRVIGETEGFLQVESGESYGYVAAGVLVALALDEPIAPYTAYIDQTRIAYAYPLLGADVIEILSPPSRMQIVATNGDFVCFEKDGGTGYVLLSEIIRYEPQTQAEGYAYIPVATILYDGPDAQSYTTDYIPANTVVALDATNNGFSRIQGSGRYVPTNTLSMLDTEPVAPTYGYWELPQILYADPDTLLQTGVTLPRDEMVEIRQALGEFYLIEYEGTLGFVPQAGMRLVVQGKTIQPLAAVVRSDARLLSQPFPFAAELAQTVPAQTHLWLRETAGDFYKVTYDGVTGYLPTSQVTSLGADVPVNGLEIYIPAKTDLLQFPSDTHGGTTGTLPENMVLTVSARNGSFYYVQHLLGSGYLPASAVVSAQDRAAQMRIDAQRYYLFLNKATCELTIYYADVYGNRTDLVYKTIVVAIGKRTTPTPSGIFELGGKERWHYFGPSYAPFAIEFTPGKYLHGPLYTTADEMAVNQERLEDFGSMATGGCIRMPYEDAMWIYFHCLSGETKLEIVGGV